MFVDFCPPVRRIRIKPIGRCQPPHRSRASGPRRPRRLALAAAAHRRPAGCGRLSDFHGGAYRRRAGPHPAHLLHPCPHIHPVLPRLFYLRRRRRRLPDTPHGTLGSAGPRLCRSRRGVRYPGAAYRHHLGAPGVGRLVDLGAAPHHHAYPVAHLCRLSDDSPLRPDTAAGPFLVGGSRHHRLY